MDIFSQLTHAQQETYIQHRDAFYQKVAEAQGNDVPYFGAIGGEITWCITPTGLGAIIKVKLGSNKVLDLTNYDSW